MGTIVHIRNPIPAPEIDVENTLAKNIYFAKRIDPRPMPKPQTLQQKLGIRYEKKVVRALGATKGISLEHNPWYEYLTVEGSTGWCIPDALIQVNDLNIVLEIKLTYTPEALEKLRNLYCPVVSLALGEAALPLVIIRNALPGIKACLDLTEALYCPDPICQWLGRGPLTFPDIKDDNLATLTSSISPRS